MPINIEIKETDLKDIREWLKKRPEKTIKELNTAIKQSVISVERDTKINAPVDTGRLRTSVHHITRELEGEVLAGVEYAIYQEYGTRYFKGRKFMTRAVRGLKSTIQRYFSRAMSRVIK